MTKQRNICLMVAAVFLLASLGYSDDSSRNVASALDEYEKTFVNPGNMVVMPEFPVTDPQPPAPAVIPQDIQDILNRYAPSQDTQVNPFPTGNNLPMGVPAGVPVMDNATPGKVEVIEVSRREDAGDYTSAVNPEDIADDIVIDVLELKNMDINDVLKLISQKTGLNVIAGNGVIGKISIYLKDVKLKDVLRIILDANDMAYKWEDGIIRVMPAKEFENRYGYSFGGQMETKITRLLYADAVDMVTMLNQIKSPAGKIIFDLKSGTLVLVDSVEKVVLMMDLIRQIDVLVETRVFELSYAPAKDVAEKITEALTKNVGRMKFDERSNKIAVTDTPQKMEEITQLIKAFDIKQQQVLIEAKIVQIVLSDQYKYGVDWQAVVDGYHNLNVFSDFDILSSSEKRGKLTIGTLSTDDYTAVVEALETVGKTNILSSPSITAVNNQEAKMLVGSTEPYVTSTTTTPASGPTTTSETVNFIDVGVKLYVTPTIHRDGFITMKIKPEISSVTSTLTTGTNNTIPVVETSQAETTVMVRNGVTIVIGGLIKDEKIGTKKKIPVLGDIPLLGGVFQNRDQSTEKTEIAIFLTPRIISGDAPDHSSPNPAVSEEYEPVQFDEEIN